MPKAFEIAKNYKRHSQNKLYYL